MCVCTLYTRISLHRITKPLRYLCIKNIFSNPAFVVLHIVIIMPWDLMTHKSACMRRNIKQIWILAWRKYSVIVIAIETRVYIQDMHAYRPMHTYTAYIHSSICMHTSICMYTSLGIHTNLCIHTNLSIHTSLCVHINMWIHTSLCIHTSMWIHTSLCMHTSLCIHSGDVLSQACAHCSTLNTLR